MSWRDDPVVENPQAVPAKPNSDPLPAVPSYLAVAGQAAIKGITGIPDFFINAPANLWNIAKTGSQMIERGIGRPDIAAPMEEAGFLTPPSPFTRAAANMGLIRPELEPQTMGQRVLDTAIQTGIGTAIAPAKSLGQAAKNIGTGLLAGTAAQATKEATGSDLAAVAIGLTTPLAVSAIANAGRATMKMGNIRKQTLQDAHAVGYVVPPSEVAPTFVGNRLESIGGKAAVGHEAILRNQQVTNALAAQEIGLATDIPLTLGALEQVRSVAAQPYMKMASLIPNGQTVMDELRQHRNDAMAFFRHYDRSADPASLTKAKTLMKKAEGLEKQFEQAAIGAGKPELIKEFQQARALYAKTYDVERALNLGDGNISAPMIGRMLDQGKPLTGGLNIIGRFAQAFPRYSREASGIPFPGVSGTDAAASALLGVIGAGSMGVPGAVAGGLPLLRGPARNLVFSPGYQSRMMVPPPNPQETRLLGLLAGRGVSGALVPPENLYGR